MLLFIQSKNNRFFTPSKYVCLLIFDFIPGNWANANTPDKWKKNVLLSLKLRKTYKNKIFNI